MLRGIHKLCDKGNWPEAREILFDEKIDAAVKDTASRGGGWGDWTPLHLACKRDPPVDIVDALISKAPIATESFDIHGRLPIHYAAEKGASADVLETLSRACPASICSTDNEGRTPLHLIFQASNKESNSENRRRFPSLTEVETLIDEEGNVVQTADNSGSLPLHWACDSIDSCSEDILLCLVENDLYSVITKNADGMTPLHQTLLMSAESQLSVDIVRILMGAGEQSLSEQVAAIEDNEGRMPLHCACKNFEAVSCDGLREIIRVYSGAAAVESQDGGYPIRILEEMRHHMASPDSIADLNEKSDMVFAHFPNVLPYRKDRERLDRFVSRICSVLNDHNSLDGYEEEKLVWTWLCTFPDAEDSDRLYSGAVDIILEAVGIEGARYLAAIETASGKSIMECCSSRCEGLLQRNFLFADRYEIQSDYSGEILPALLTVDGVDCEKGSEPGQKSMKDKNGQKVSVKFISSRAEFHREKSLYLKLNSQRPSNATMSHPVLPLVETYDLDRIGGHQETNGDAKFARDVQCDRFLSHFRYALVFKAPGTSLSDILKANGQIAGQHVMKCAKDIALALHHIHSKDISYGSLNVNNIVELDGNYTLRNMDSACHLNYQGELRGHWFGSRFSTGALPPELIAKLDAKGVREYESYWKRVHNCSLIAKMLVSDKIRTKICAKVDAFLGDVQDPDYGLASFSHVWDQMLSNATFWKKILPRRENEKDFYVPKCFMPEAMQGATDHQHKLPYDLIPPSFKHDVWAYGVLLYELLSGNQIFHVNKCNDIVNNLDFVRLFEWGKQDPLSLSELEAINDPLARDLLRILLSVNRPADMHEVLSHPFFCIEEITTAQLAQLRSNILRGESSHALRLAKERRQCQIEKDKKDWLQSRTEHVDLVSPAIQLKLKYSTWRQWRRDYQPEDAAFPTAFILLPYKLAITPRGALEIAEQDEDLAMQFGINLVNVMHYTALASDASKQIGGNPLAQREKWNKLNLPPITEKPNMTLVDICEGIVSRAETSKSILEEILSVFVDGSSISDSTKLVSDVLAAHVDMTTCKEVVSKAACVGKAFSSLLESISNKPKMSAKEIVSDQFEAVLGPQLANSSLNNKTTIDKKLFNLTQDFIEDPVVATNKLLKKSISAVTACLFAKKSMYMYLVDECTNLPSESQGWEMEASKDLLAMILPCLYHSMKALCATKSILAVPPLLGLGTKKIPQGWNGIKECRFGAFKECSEAEEFDTFSKALSENLFKTSSKGAIATKAELLSQYSKFLLLHDSQQANSSLFRLCFPDGSVLWTTNEGKAKLIETANKDSEDYEKASILKAKDEFNEILQGSSTMLGATAAATTDGFKLWHDPRLSSVDEHLIAASKSPALPESDSLNGEENSNKENDHMLDDKRMPITLQVRTLATQRQNLSARSKTKSVLSPRVSASNSSSVLSPRVSTDHQDNNKRETIEHRTMIQPKDSKAGKAYFQENATDSKQSVSLLKPAHFRPKTLSQALAEQKQFGEKGQSSIRTPSPMRRPLPDALSEAKELGEKGQSRMRTPSPMRLTHTEALTEPKRPGEKVPPMHSLSPMRLPPTQASSESLRPVANGNARPHSLNKKKAFPRPTMRSRNFSFDAVEEETHITSCDLKGNQEVLHSVLVPNNDAPADEDEGSVISTLSFCSSVGRRKNLNRFRS